MNVRSLPSINNYLGVCLCVATAVWATWLVLLGPAAAIAVVSKNWQAAITMVFGSFIAGSTSAGGGAVAFPVLTKVLGASSVDAKLFSLAIQSVGMTSASVTICLLRIPVNWRAIGWGSLGGGVGVCVGLFFLAPNIPTVETKILFTAIQVGFSIVLLRSLAKRKIAAPVRLLSPTVLVIAGCVGGIASGIVGSGIDLIVFSVLVLLAGLSEKVATPTSVMIMAINSLVAMSAYLLNASQLPENVFQMWLAAVPVVVIGAPVGAIVCSNLNRTTIAKILVALIMLEATSTCLLMPFSPTVVVLGLGATSVSIAAFLAMARYQPSTPNESAFDEFDVQGLTLLEVEQSD